MENVQPTKNIQQMKNIEPIKNIHYMKNTQPLKSFNVFLAQKNLIYLLYICYII